MEILLLQGDAQRRLTVWRAKLVTAGRCVAAPYRVAGKSCYCREMRSGALPCGGQILLLQGDAYRRLTVWRSIGGRP